MSEYGQALLCLAGALGALLAFGRLARTPRGIPRRAYLQEKPAAPFGVLEAVQARLQRTPFERMSRPEQRYLLDLLWKADSQDVDDEVHARVHTLLGQLCRAMGRSAAAEEHFCNAFQWDLRRRAA